MAGGRVVWPRGFTLRAVMVGCALGLLLTASNMWFGLQTGWITMASVQSAVLGYAVFSIKLPCCRAARPLSVDENVALQTTAVAAATMPLAAGFVGIIPALRILGNAGHDIPLQSAGSQIIWSLAVCLIGVFVAVPFRIPSMRLRFPSGTATAAAIAGLHHYRALPDGTYVSPDTATALTRSRLLGATLRRRGGASAAEDAQASGDAPSVSRMPPRSDASQCSAGSDTPMLHGAESNVPTFVHADDGTPRVDAAEVLVQPDSAQVPLRWARRRGSQGKDGAGEVETEAGEPSTGSSASTEVAGEEACIDADAAAHMDTMRLLRFAGFAFGGSAAVTLLSFLFPVLGGVPLATYVRLPGITAWGWTFTVSPSYAGQGMIMGTRTCVSMLAGAVVGWGIIGPVAQAVGWAPGAPMSWPKGGKAFILWISLSVMLADAAASVAVLILNALARCWARRASRSARTSATAAFLQPVTQAPASSLVEAGDAHRPRAAFSRAGEDVAAGFEHSLPPLHSSVAVRVDAQQEELLHGGTATPGSGSPNASAHSTSVLLPRGALSSREGGGGADGEGALLAAGVDSNTILRAEASEEVPRVVWVSGFVASSIVCVIVLSTLMHIPWYEALVSIIISVPIAAIAIRALGETDMNPVSGLGKIAQALFAILTPGNVVSNVISGAVAEASAQQAGDLLQDFKTGSLLYVSPRTQFAGQIIGSLLSVFASVAAFKLFDAAFGVPSATLPAPTALLWVVMAQLTSGHDGSVISRECIAFCAVFGALWFVLCAAKALHESHSATAPAPAAAMTATNRRAPSTVHDEEDSALQVATRRRVACAAAARWYGVVAHWIPSATAFAIGMYVTPNWTLTRVLGAGVATVWRMRRPTSYKEYMIMMATGLVLGDGIMSIFTALLVAAGAHPVSCGGCAVGMCGNGCP